mmetsp:Transcript_1741/g.6819  ORF Transcript_1741/g.6819 Transcript_1741/m.6819 type:complete len:324 (-) Transcript_1741:17-988(-)
MRNDSAVRQGNIVLRTERHACKLDLVDLHRDATLGARRLDASHPGDRRPLVREELRVPGGHNVGGRLRQVRGRRPASRGWRGRRRVEKLKQPLAPHARAGVPGEDAGDGALVDDGDDADIALEAWQGEDADDARADVLEVQPAQHRWRHAIPQLDEELVADQLGGREAQLRVHAPGRCQDPPKVVRLQALARLLRRTSPEGPQDEATLIGQPEPDSCRKHGRAGQRLAPEGAPSWADRIRLRHLDGEELGGLVQALQVRVPHQQVAHEEPGLAAARRRCRRRRRRRICRGLHLATFAVRGGARPAPLKRQGGAEGHGSSRPGL